MPQQRKNSGAGIGAIMVLAALAFIVGPFLLGVTGVSQYILVGFGVALLAIGSIILIITRLYVKTSADEAFVRTGMGGQKIIIDGGALVIPVVHKIIWVSLNTMRLDVERDGTNALITGDKLRADIKAEFYIKVQKESTDVVNASTSLGEKSISSESVKDLVMEKLVSALRTVAATKDLYDLNEKRDAFADAVQKIVEVDLKHNGLTLETVTVSMLDQTPPGDMQAESNIFDAEGRRKIAEITQKMRVETNQIERDADKKVKEQDVDKEKFVYTQEIDRATAEANQDSDIQKANAAAKQEAETFAAAQDETSRVREVKRDETVAVSEMEKNSAIQVADQLREKAAQTARVDQEKAVAVADREKMVEIANKEKEQADAEAKRNTALATAEKEKQDIATVEITETAKRKAEEVYITDARVIDKEAYKLERDAQANKVSAEKNAEARVALATAEETALTAEAKGNTAKDMVPVNVEARRVEVEKNRVNDVLKPELKAKADHQEISVKLELGLKDIEVNGEVNKERAKAMGLALSNADMNIFGDPTTMAAMMKMFQGGQGAATAIEGFTRTIDSDAMNTLGGIVGGVRDTLTSIFQGIFGKTLDQNTITGIASKIAENPSIAGQIKDKVADAMKSSKGQTALATFLTDTFGEGFDLASATKLISALKENPDLVSQLSGMIDKLRSAK